MSNIGLHCTCSIDIVYLLIAVRYNIKELVIVSKYFVTTPEPGESDVLMYGLVERPSSIAFFATRPA